jgi:RimJ/RimL family protein N-acetyltransferase
MADDQTRLFDENNCPALPIQTTRLLLRELTEADADAVYLLNRNPEVVRYLGEPVLQNPEHALAILRSHILPQYRLYGVGRFAVIQQSDGAFVGWCGLKYSAELAEYDLGYRLHSQHWGLGYATEAARAVLEWARQALPPTARIVGRVHVDNAASARVLQKLGLRFESERAESDGLLAVTYTYTSEDWSQL